MKRDAITYQWEDRCCHFTLAERLKGNSYGTLLYQRQKQLEGSLTWLMHCISDAAERTKNERHLSLQGQKELGLSVVGSPSEKILQSPRLKLTLSCSQWIMAS